MGRRFRVVIADLISGSPDAEQEVLGDLAEVEALNVGDEDDLAGRIEDADALLVYHYIDLSRRTIERLERCRVIVRCGVGFDNVDHIFARERGIPVCNVPDYGTEDVADAAIGMMLALTRGIVYLNSLLRAGEGIWSYTQALSLQRLRGRIFAVVGLGRIGTAAALRAKALGMDVAFYDPYRQDGYEKSLGIRRVEALEDLLEEAFALSVHCPLTEETHHLIDAEAVSRMPVGSYLVNTARGPVVDTAAIPDAIVSGRLAGAGIDVLEEEPPGEDDALVRAWRDPEHPAHHRVLITPHSAFYAEQSFMDLRVKGAQACRRALLGQRLRNVVNP